MHELGYRKVRLLLFATVLTASMLPSLAAIFYFHEVINTALNISFNQELSETLQHSADNLKKLRDLDEANADNYRQEFSKVENLRQIYSVPDMVKANLLASLMIYFGLGLAIAIFVSLLLSFYLSRKINNSYVSAVDELVKQKERNLYLQDMANWQELAKMLAHEIKNPLTPIEVIVSSLSKHYKKMTDREFCSYLKESELLVSEEIGHLKQIVNNFSDFSKVPKIHLVRDTIGSFIDEISHVLNGLFLNLDISFAIEGHAVIVAIDKPMLRQVFVNIIRNGIEANPSKAIKFTVGVFTRYNVVIIEVSNTGEVVAEERVVNLFEPYVTSKAKKSNMGLGLTIAKKIVIEHRGSISYRNMAGHPCFVIHLPIANT